MKNNAFTLAEVLITLVIIGIIASMTIPTLMNNTNKQEYVSRLKKTYSTLSKAANAVIAEHGSAKNWADSSESVYTLFKEHLQLSKDCGSAAGCFPQTPIKKLGDGSSLDWNNDTSFKKLILADGVNVSFESNTNCNFDDSSSAGVKDGCGFIQADINGEKGPNIIGIDVFEFVLKENGLYPDGCDYDNLCDKNHSGYACTCKVIRENAMNY